MRHSFHRHGHRDGLQVPAIAVNDTAVAPRNTAVTIDVLANDTEPMNPATVAIVALPLHGQLHQRRDRYSCVYASSELPGSRLFSYIVQDNQGVVSNVASVKVTVRSPVPPGDSCV